MKFISVLILFVCVTAATFSKWILILSYDINENFIAKELCVNKNDPAKHCNGVCFLNKQLGNEEKPNAVNPTLKEQFEIQLFFFAKKEITSATSTAKTEYSIASINFTQQEVEHAVFHPPGISV